MLVDLKVVRIFPMTTSFLFLIWATLKCSLASVFISLLTQGLEITFFVFLFMGTKCHKQSDSVTIWSNDLVTIGLNDSIKMLSSIAMWKSFKYLDNLLKTSVASWFNKLWIHFCIPECWFAWRILINRYLIAWLTLTF